MSKPKVVITEAYYFLLHPSLGSSMFKVVSIQVWMVLSLRSPVSVLPGWRSGKSYAEPGVSHERSSYALELENAINQDSLFFPLGDPISSLV